MDRLHDRIEEACLNAWPALRTVHYDGWILRFADGETRRSNSVNIVHDGVVDLQTKIDVCEAVFRVQAAPPCFRIRSTDDPALDAALAGRGYGVAGETCTLLMPSIRAAIGSAALAADVTFAETPDADWCAAHARFVGTPLDAALLRRRLLGLIAVPTIFAACRDAAGAIVSLAYGAAHDGMLCLQWVATDPGLRARGLSRATLRALLARAARLGLADAAVLQVEAANAPALRLYRGLGFAAEVNRYHYRQ